MESSCIIEDVITRTEYFRGCLENLLSQSQPAFHCLKLVLKILLHGPDGSGKRLLARELAKNLNTKFCEEKVSDLFDENIVGTEKKVRSTLSKISDSSPCVIYFSGYELFCGLDEADIDRIEHCIRESLDELLDKTSQPIIFVAATNDFQIVYQTPLANMFQYDICLKSPNKKQAEEFLRSIKIGTNLSSDPISLLTECTNNEYFIGNLFNLMSKSEVNHRKTIVDRASDKPDEQERPDNVPTTRWLDIGGLSNARQEIIDAIQLSMEYPQLKKSGLRRTGILLHGPPGTGKTLLAKAVATECSLNFINVKGPELLNEYVGQSESNVRKLFDKARESSPSVIFFDEIDSLAPNRGQAGDSGGVMDRMVSQILAEMDGVGKTDGVFVIGATNRVDLVDPSLLRPGRFDKILEIPIPVGKDDRLQILQALTRKMKLADDVTLEDIEARARSNMSGAEFQGLCSRALHRTFERCVEQVELEQKTEEDVEIVTTMQDFVMCLD